jgi:hypothetical protein
MGGQRNRFYFAHGSYRVEDFADVIQGHLYFAQSDGSKFVQNLDADRAARF